MRPGILHARGQRNRLALDQLRARDIHVVVREIGPHVCVKRDFSGRRLGRSESRCGHAACDKGQKSSAVEHGIPPIGYQYHGFGEQNVRGLGELTASPDSQAVGVILRLAAALRQRRSHLRLPHGIQ
jgi:hypothetical protein